MRLSLAAWALLIAVPASGAPSYNIRFEWMGPQYNVTQATPFSHQAAYPVPGTLPGCDFTGNAFSYPGRVGVNNRIDMYWPGPGAGARYDTFSYATANDFVISGPPAAQVAGTLHLRLRARMTRAGGYATSSAHGSRINVDVRARNGVYVALGDAISNNNNTYGNGVLSGVSSSEVDYGFTLSGNFPVGAPFDVYMRIFAVETVNGNGASDPNPGFVWGDATSLASDGLQLEESSGQVMTLPAGYTLNSSSWNITNNTLHSTADAGSLDPPTSLKLLIDGANPSRGEVRFSLALPVAATANLGVFDADGRCIRHVGDGWRPAGSSQYTWDGRTDDGRLAGAGVYFARAQAGGKVATRRFARVR